MLPLHPDLSVDALAGEPRVNGKVCEPAVDDLEEVAEELRALGLKLVEIEGSDLPDRCLEPRIRLVLPHCSRAGRRGLRAMDPQLAGEWIEVV